MREAYKEYVREHPEELEQVIAVIQRSKNIEQARQERAKSKIALIQKFREVNYNAETRK